MLFRSEDIDFDAPVLEFSVSYFAVDLGRDVVQHLAGLAADGVAVVGQILGAEGLDREGHVHDLGRVSVAGGEVDEAAFRDYIYRAAVREFIAHYVVAGRGFADGIFSQFCDSYFAVEVAGVAEDGAVFHEREVLCRYDVVAACYGDEDVAFSRCLFHGHDIETVHYGLHGLDRVDFGDYDFGAESFGPHGDAFAAPAVACDYDGLAGDDKVGRAVDSVPDGLACAVAVVEEVLAGGVIDQHHRELQGFLAVEVLQAEDAGGGLFAAADDVRDELRELAVDHVDKIATVVDYDVRADFDDPADAAFVLFGGSAVDGEDVETFMDEGGCDVVLRAEGIATGYVHFGPAAGKDFAEMCGLGLKVYRERYFETFEWFVEGEFLLESVEKGHVPADPFDFELSGFPESGISDF